MVEFVMMIIILLTTLVIIVGGAIKMALVAMDSDAGPDQTVRVVFWVGVAIVVASLLISWA